MEHVFEMKIRSSTQGPASRLLQVVDEAGRECVALRYADTHHNHPQLLAYVQRGAGLHQGPSIKGLPALLQHDVDSATLLFETGAVLPLADLIQYAAPPGLRAGLELMLEGALVLSEASRASHCDQPTCHRNLNPWRILLGQDGQILIIGHGLPAIELDAVLHHQAPVLHAGSVRYAPPERFLEDPETPSSDLFSLAVIMLELLTAQTPYDGPPQAVYQQVRRVEIRRALYRHRHVLPAPLRSLLSRMLQVRPSDRFSTVDDCVAAIRAVLADPSVTGHPLGDVARGWIERARLNKTAGRPVPSAPGARLHDMDRRASAPQDTALSGADLRDACLREIGFTFDELSGADLANVNLKNANLARANLHASDLREANLSRVNLRGANLRSADLRRARLLGTDLAGADLSGANLSHARLAGVSSGQLVGTPAALPEGWCLVEGYLLGPLATLRGARLSGADLREMNLHGCELSNAVLDGAVLDGALLAGADLSDASLRGASLRDARTQVVDEETRSVTNLRGADLSHASLHRVDLSGLCLEGASLRKVDLRGKDLRRTNLRGAKLGGALLGRADLSDADLTEADLDGVDLRASRYTRTTLWPAGFAPVEAGAYLLCRGADLSGADLHGADLRQAPLADANLSEADLSGTNLFGQRLSSVNLCGANLSGAQLRGASLDEANLSGANLSGADLRGEAEAKLLGRRVTLLGADLRGARLQAADLCNAVLREANLRGADLRDATLCGADLRGADLSRAVLKGADLSGARFSRSTRWPSSWYVDRTTRLPDGVRLRWTPW